MLWAMSSVTSASAVAGVSLPRHLRMRDSSLPPPSAHAGLPRICACPEPGNKVGRGHIFHWTSVCGRGRQAPELHKTLPRSWERLQRPSRTLSPSRHAPPNVTSAPKRVRNYISQAALGGASAFPRSGKGLAPRLSRSRRLSDSPPRSLPGSFRFLRRTGAWSGQSALWGAGERGQGLLAGRGEPQSWGPTCPARVLPPRSDRPPAHTGTWPGLLLPPPRVLPPPAPVCNVLPPLGLPGETAQISGHMGGNKQKKEKKRKKQPERPVRQYWDKWRPGTKN